MFDLVCGCIVDINWHHYIPCTYWSASTMEEFSVHLKEAILMSMQNNLYVRWIDLLMDRNPFTHWPVNEFGHNLRRILFEILRHNPHWNGDSWDLCVRRDINGRGIASPILREVWHHASKWQIHDPTAPRTTIISMVDSRVFVRDYHWD